MHPLQVFGNICAPITTLSLWEPGSELGSQSQDRMAHCPLLARITSCRIASKDYHRVRVSRMILVWGPGLGKVKVHRAAAHRAAADRAAAANNPTRSSEKGRRQMPSLPALTSSTALRNMSGENGEAVVDQVEKR
jgi:hypothetical protein